MNNLIIRAAQTTDIAAITEIYQFAVKYGTASFEIEPPTEQEMLNRYQALRTKGYPYLVAQINEKVVGYAYAGPYHHRLAYLGTVEDSIYIHHNFHQQGIGKALLKQLIAESTESGFRQMVAVIGDSTNKGSIKLHASHGFKAVGTLKSVGWKHQRWLDVVYMQLALGLADNSAFAGLEALDN